MAVDCIGLDTPRVPWKSELLPGALMHVAHFVHVEGAARTEHLTALSRAQDDTIEPRISREEGEKLLEHPCHASALSTKRHSVQRNAQARYLQG